VRSILKKKLLHTLDINLFQLLIILGSLQALIFSTIIFVGKRYRTKANYFLGLTVLITALSLLQHMLIDTNVLPEESTFRKLYIPIQWLILPMLFLHIKEFLYGNSMPSKVSIYLVLPFLMVSIVHLIHFLYFSSTTEIAMLPDFNEEGLLLYTNILSFVFNGVVIYLILKIIDAFLKQSKSATKLIKNKILMYRRIIFLSVLCVSVGLISLAIMAFFNIFYSFIIYPFYIVLSISIYWVGYVGIRKAEVVNKLNEGEQKSISGYDMFQRINQFISVEKKYLDVNISLNDIASTFAITAGYLSKLINTHTEKNFSDYINQQRINVAKKMIENPQFNHYKIESIGLESGFKSKSNFYSAFKKFTGQTPAQYRKEKKKS